MGQTRGKKVALICVNMTDTMYNPERPPEFDHFHRSTDLVVGKSKPLLVPLCSPVPISVAEPAFIFAKINVALIRRR